MEIKLQSYNLQQAEKTIIEKCIRDNYKEPIYNIAVMLGFSERGLLRKLNLYELTKEKLREEGEIEQCVLRNIKRTDL